MCLLIGDISATFTSNVGTVNYDVSGDTIIHGYTQLPIILSSYKKYIDISRNPNLWDDKFLFNSFSYRGVYRSNNAISWRFHYYSA